MESKFFEDERPLEKLCPDGGFCGIFQTVGCIGDSLASGEFEGQDNDGAPVYLDQFRYSWIQFMARKCGFTAYNFTRGGMTAHEFNDSFGEAIGFNDPAKVCQAYVIALGVNDVHNERQPLGDLSTDVDLENYEKNAKTFAGEYCKIISKIKEKQPKARIFLVTMPKEYDEDPIVENDIITQKHRKLLYEISKLYEFTYVIDLFTYAPVYNQEFRKKYFLSGHMNACGYLLTAEFMVSYIDYIIRHNMEDFSQIGFVGTPYHNATAKW